VQAQGFATPSPGWRGWVVPSLDQHAAKSQHRGPAAHRYPTGSSNRMPPSRVWRRKQFNPNHRDTRAPGLYHPASQSGKTPVRPSQGRHGGSQQQATFGARPCHEKTFCYAIRLSDGTRSAAGQ
jgi:hypothetical protein